MIGGDSFKRLGNYQILKSLGVGGFGEVSQAEHLYFHNIVAIKILRDRHASQKERADFIGEARKLKDLTHRYILPVIDVGDEQGVLYMVMEYAPGGSLRDRLKKHSNQLLPLQETLTILWQIGQALHFLHQQKEPFVHRDLKPENILFNERGEALLADFGLTTILSGGKTTRFDDKVGSPDYMAPEQFDGIVSVKSDQYALGCIAYELLTGQHPFPVPTNMLSDQRWMTLYVQHYKATPEAPTKLNPQLLSSIDEVILKAMAKNRNHRHKDVLTFVELLRKPPPLSFEQQYSEGNKLYVEKKYGDAITAYQQAIQLKPDSADVHVNMGIAYYQLGKYNEAIAAFERALGYQSEYVKAHYHKGLAHSQLGQHKQAAMAYQETVRTDPNHKMAYRDLGDALDMLEQNAEAVDAYKKAVKLDPNDADIRTNLGIALRKCGECRAAIQAFEQAIQRNPKLAKAYYNKGNAHYDCKEYRQALDAYNQAIVINPTYGNAYHGKSTALDRLGILEEARQAEEQARQLGYTG